MTETPDSPVVRRAAAVVVAASVLAALYFGRELLIPITLAVIVSFLLAPAVRALERLRIGREPAVAMVVATGLAIVGCSGWLLASQASELASELPRYRHNIIRKVRELRTALPDSFSGASSVADDIRREIEAASKSPTTNPSLSEGDVAATQAATHPSAPELDSTQLHSAGTPDEASAPPVKVEVITPGELTLPNIGKLLSPVVHPLASAVVAVAFIVFLLIYREDLRDRFIRVCGRARIPVTTAALTDTGVRVARYFAAQAVANTVVGVAIAAGLFLIGVPNALLWGLMAAVLRFVPVVGPVVAALFPAVLSAAIFDGWWQAILVVAWTVLVDVSCANFLEPWLFSARVGASPTAILVSFVFWTWMWGAIGLLLATPITVCLIVLGKHEPAFEIFYILLSRDPVLDPKLRLYQRMLAKDRGECVAVVQQFAGQVSAVETIDGLILPVLAQLERDRRAGLIEESRVEFAQRVTPDLLERLPGAESPPTPEPARRAPVFVVPDRGAFDELLPAVLSRVEPTLAARINVIPPTTLVAEVTERARAGTRRDGCPGLTGRSARVPYWGPMVVLLSIEPGLIDRVLLIAKRLTVALPRARIHIGLFGQSERRQALARRLRHDPNIRIWDAVAKLVGGLNSDARLEQNPAVERTEPVGDTLTACTAHGTVNA